METRANLPTKILSLFLSVLMAFSCFSIALPNLAPDSFAAGAYKVSEVKELLEKAANNFTGSSTAGTNQFTWSGSMEVIEAAQAVFDYAINTYYNRAQASNREYVYSSGAKIAAQFITDLAIPAGNQQSLVNYVLNPRAYASGGDSIVSYGSSNHDGTLPITGSDGGSRGSELTENDYSKVEWNDSDYGTVTESNFTHVFITELSTQELTEYLLSFDSVEDIPNKFPTKVSFSYTYSGGRYAMYRNNGRQYTAYKWNYLSKATTKANTKDNKAKRELTKFVEYFNEDTLGVTFDEMLTMSAADLYNLYLVAEERIVAVADRYQSTVINHFEQNDAGYTYQNVIDYRDNLWDAYCVALIKDSLDVLNNNIPDTDYSEYSYAQMAALYGSLTKAYEVFNDVKNSSSDLADAVNYIVANYPDYVAKYDSVGAMTQAIEAYLTDLYNTMRMQNLRELLQSMESTYDSNWQYVKDEEAINKLDDLDTTQVAAVLSMVQGYNAALNGSYNFIAAEINAILAEMNADLAEGDEEFTMAKWNTFVANLEAKLAVRDDEVVFDSYLDYFYEYLMQDFTKLSNEELMDLHKNAQYEYEDLVEVYNQFVAEYGKTWTDELFTIDYNGEKVLLQDAISANYVQSKSVLELYIRERNAAQLNAIAAYPTGLTVDFTNYAQLKSVLVHFDEDLYQYCLATNVTWTRTDKDGNEEEKSLTKENWVTSDQLAIYNTQESLLASWKAFVQTKGYEAFDHNFTFADENGLYAIRHAGSQIITEIVDNEENEVQIGYPNDIARDGADDNYSVEEDEINSLITKIDNAVTSRDFASLIGLKDLAGSLSGLGLEIDEEAAKQIVDLPSFVNVLFEEAFSDDIMNMLVGMIFPLLTDLLDNTLKDVLKDLGTPDAKWGNASGAYYLDFDITIATLTGNLNIFVDTDWHDHDGNGRTEGPGSEMYRLQRDFPSVFADLGLHVYPNTFAAFMAQLDPAAFGPDTEFYKTLTAPGVGRDWSKLVSEDDPETAEDESKALDLDWGIYDFESFTEVFGNVLETIIPLLQTALGNTAFDGYASDAAFLYGKVKIWGVEHGLGAVGDLGLSINPLNAYSNLLVPLFETLGVPSSAIPTLKGDFDGVAVAEAILNPVKALLDKIVAAPLTSILEMLPNLIYFLSMDSVTEIISQLVITLNLEVAEIDIKTDLSGAIGDIVSVAEGALGGLISFDLNLDLGELLDLDSMLDFNITDLGDIINTLVGDSMALPYLDQTKIMFSSTWTEKKSANGSMRVDLEANKADILFAIFDYLILALKQEGFLDGLLGDSVDAPIKELINSVTANVFAHPDDIVAAIIELLVPNKDANGDPEYELIDMNWAQNDWSYSKVDGATSTDIVYLEYGNDWSEADANYLVDNIDRIFNEVMNMTGSDPIVISDMVKELLDGVFTNATLTTLIELLAGFGDSPSAVMDEILTNQLGVDICVWFESFGYLYPVSTWKDDAVVITPDNNAYVNHFKNVTGTANEDGTITWFYKGEALEDGDMDMFIDIICDLLDYAEIVIGFLFGGQNISVFGNLLELQGYESYATTLGVLLEMLGVENLPPQSAFSARGQSVNRGLRQTLHALANRIDQLLNSEHIIKDVLEMVPDLIYWIESDGLSVFLMNLLMPVWVIVDTVRPLIDVNVNGLLSLIVSDLLNGYEFDLNSILQFIGSGINANAMTDIEYKSVNIDIKHLNLSNIIKAVDQFFGTNLTDSGLVGMSINGMCAGATEYESVTGTGYKTPVSAADTITLLITGILDCLSYPAQDTSKTNGDVIFGMLAGMLEMPELADIYPTIAEVLQGIQVDYTIPEWAYMGNTEDEKQDIIDAAKNGTFNPVPSIGYLAYQTDWTADTAKNVYAALNGILNQFLPDILGDMGSSIADVVSNLLKDNLYSDEMMDSIAIMLCELLAQIEGLLGVVDVLLGTSVVDLVDFIDITYEYEPILDENGEVQYEVATSTTDKKLTRYISYFDDDLHAYVYEEATPEDIADDTVTKYVVLCDYVYETNEDGSFKLDDNGHKIPKKTVVCTKEWGIDEAETLDAKKDAFLEGASEIIRPLNGVLSWLLFGDDYAFFTASEGEYAENGEIVYKKKGDLLVLSGGHGYTMGLAPILEALGFTNLATEAECYDPATGTYDATVAIRSIFNSALELVERADADPVGVVFDIVANLIYFLNANGIGSSVENLLAPVLGYLEIVDAFVEDDFSINGLLSMLLGMDINVTYPEGHPQAGHINLTLAKILEMLPAFLGGSLPLVISDEIEDIILSLYVGKLAVIDDSAAYLTRDGSVDWTSYRLNVKGYEEHVITILLSLVLDLAKTSENRDFIVGLLGDSEDAGNMYDAIVAIISGMEFDYVDVNWEYMYEIKDNEGNVTNEEAAKAQLDKTVADITDIDPTFENPYLSYNTNWDAEAAEEIYTLLGTILQDLLPDLIDADSLAAFVDAMLNDNVYSNDILNMVLELITNLLGDFKDYLGLADALLETGILDWFDYCEQVDETTYVEATEEQKADETVVKYSKETVDGEDIYTEAADGTYVAETEKVWKVKAEYADWGFNTKDADGDGDVDADDNQKIFIDAVVDLLAPADGLLAWLFFGKTITLFNGSKVVDTDENGDPIYEVLITLNGGNGYEEAIVPLLEMLLGCVGADGKSTLFTADDCYDAEKGIYRTSEAIGSILRALLAFVDEVSANPVDEVFELLPNLFYFLNSDGFVAVVNNLIAPVSGILTSLGAFGVEIDLTNLVDGLDITNLTTDALLDFVFNMDLLAELTVSDTMLNIFKYFYHDYKMMSYTSANGEKAYRVVTAGTTKDGKEFNHNKDTLTTLVSFVLDLAVENPKFLAGLIGDGYEDMITTIIELLKGVTVTYTDMNWDYMYEVKDAEGNVTNAAEALAKLQAAAANNTVIAPEFNNPYLAYNTNWDAETSAEVYALLETLLQDLLPDLIDADSLAAFVDAMLNDNVYSNDILNMVIELITNLLADFEQYLAAADVLLDTDIAAWFALCDKNPDGTYVRNEEGDLVCTKDWGFDAEGADKQQIFIDAVVELLAPADGLLAWLFFGEDITLFNKATGEVQITLNGGEGYAKALVPLLEMLLGCVDAEGKSTLFTAADCYDAEKGIYRTSEAIRGILEAVLAFVDEVSANPVDEVFELLPNLFYFLNSDGAVVVVNNLIAPAKEILNALPMFGVEFDLANLVEGLDLFNITTDALLDFVFNMELLADLKITDTMLNIFKYFYHDYKIMSYTSANAETAYRVVTAGYEKDTLTTLVSFVLDLALINPDFIAGLLGEEYDAIIDTILKLIKGVEVTYSDMNWDYMYELKDENGKVYNEAEALEQLKAAVEGHTALVPTFKNPYLAYNTNWNEKSSKAVYELLENLLKDLLPDLIDADSLADFVDAMLNDNVYSNDILNMVIELITNLLGDFKDYLDVADAVLNTDVAAWFEYCELVDETTYVEATEEQLADATVVKYNKVTVDETESYVEAADGTYVAETEKVWKVKADLADWGFNTKDADEDGDVDIDDNQKIFIDAVVELLAPADALLNWLFFGESITLFTTSEQDENGEFTLEPIITLNGGKGYEMALVPLLEAILGLDNDGNSLLPTAAECGGNTSEAIRGILNAVFAFVDKVSANPVDAVFELLPNLFYFLNSDGAVVVVNNLIAPVKEILSALSVFGVDFDLKTLIEGLDITNLTTDAVLDFVLNLELLEGVVIPDEMLNIFKYFYHTYEVTSYTSANTLTAYRVVTETDTKNYNKDTLTTLVSFVLDLAVNNPEFLAGLLGEDYEEMIKTILELIKGMDVNYKNINWKSLDKNFVNPYLKYNTDWSKETADKVYEVLKDILEKMLPGLIDEDAESLKAIIDGILVDNVYTDEILVTVIELLANLLGDFADYLGVADALLGTNTEQWFKWCKRVETEVTNDETGEVTTESEWVCEKDWGIDEATDENGNGSVNDEKQELFIDAIVDVLSTADGLLDWLFFGDSITLFNTYTGDIQITLNGGNGYAEALVPLLEAILGVDANNKSFLYTPEQCKVTETDENGNVINEYYSTSIAIEGILRAVLGFVDKACANPIKTVFEIIPNLFYFIESDGLVAVVNNLLAPAAEVLDKLDSFGVELDLSNLVEGLDILNLTTENLVTFLNKILKDNGIVVEEELMDILLYFYNGYSLASFTSANGKQAFRIDAAGHESDLLTTLVSLVLDIAVTNRDFVVDLLGGDEEAEKIFDTILKVIKGYPVTYVNMNWALLDRTFVNPYLAYATDWNEETADMVYDVLTDLLEELLPGLLDEDAEDIKTVIDGLLEDNVYTDEILVTVIELLTNLVGDFADYLGVADALLGTNTDQWFKWCKRVETEVTNEETGEVTIESEWKCVKDWGIDELGTIEEKQDKFIAAIVEVLSTADGLLNWLFFGDSITLFNTYTGDVQITLNGGKGYEMALVPLLEAILGLDEEGKTFLYTADECGNDTSKAIEGILRAVLGFVDKACDNPLKTVFELLPNLFYFIESDGLVVVVNNLLAPVKDLLAELKNLGVDLDLDTLVDGLTITNLTTENLISFLEGILDDNNIVVPDAMMDILLHFYNEFDRVEFTSANLKRAYRIDVTNHESDVLTTIVSFVVDLAIANKAFVVDLLGGDAEAEEMYDTILSLIKGVDVTYTDMNWAALDMSFYNPYLEYNTNWTDEAAAEVYTLLEDLLADLLPGLIDEDAEDLKTIINALLEDNVYTDEILVTVIELLVNLVGDFAQYLGVADALLGVDTAQWFNWCKRVETEVTNEETGEVTIESEWVCEKDWGIDDAATVEEKQELFIDAIVDVLATADGLLNWLFFGDSITLFNSHIQKTDKDGNPVVDAYGDPVYEILITLNGGNGYEMALVPLLEALFGLDENDETLLPTAAECHYNTSEAIEGILRAVLAFVDKVCANPVKEVFALLPNLFYFINSDGLVTVVNNLVAPAKEILKELETFGVELDLENLVDGLNIFDLTTENLITFLNGILADNNIVVPEVMMNILLYFYNDFTLTPFTSANGQPAYRVDTDGYEGDILTTIVSFVLDLAILNEEFVKDLLGEDNAGIYDAVVKIIAGLEVVYVDMDWGYMYEDDPATTVNEALLELADKAASGKPFVDNYTNTYLETYTRTDWTEDTAATVYSTLVNIATELIGSLLEDGQEDLEDLVTDLLNGEVYTEKNLNTIIELIVNLIADFADYLSIVDVILGTGASDPYTGWMAYCKEVTVTETNEETGETTTDTEWVCDYNWGVDDAADDEAKKDAFLDGIRKILDPANALLAWLFFGKDITLFTTSEQDANGEYTLDPIITLNGGNGYSEALVPLLEALFGCVEEVDGELVSTLPTMEECKNENGEYMVSEALVGIFESALDFVKEVSDDPVAEVFELLPNLLYFINANGLSVVVNNLLAPVLGLLEHLSAFGLDVDLAELLGMEELDLTDLTLGSILDIVAGFGVEINLTDEIITILEEFFFNAKPVTYKSALTDANGVRETAYRVDTAGTEQDTLTTLLCLVLDLLYTNKDLLVDLIGSEELYDAIIAILSGIDVSYVDINWGYMYMDEFVGEDATAEEIEAAKAEALNKLLQVGFPAVDEDDIPYLKYSTDWTEEAAANVYSILGTVVDMILPSILEEGQEDLADFVFSLLSAELYKDEMLDTIIELIVNLIADFADFLELADVVLGTEVADAQTGWMAYCEEVTITETNDETGETTTSTEWVCNYDWGVDTAETDEAKKDAFLAGLAKILDPANALLSWIFFGQSYEFFWGTASEETGSALFTLNGGHGYIEALVPLLELIGCENLPTLEECWSEENNAYMVSTAIAGIFDSALNLVQSISDNPVEVVFTLVPSLIYFINANGLSVVVNNLLAPVSSLLNSLGAFGLDVDLASLIEGLDITNITMDALLGLLVDALGITLTPEMIKILNTFFYVCEVQGYQSATGDASVKLKINDHGGDILTVILNLVLDVALYEANAPVFADLLGEETYVALVDFLTAASAGGYQYEDINWGFMYNDQFADSEDVIADSLAYLLVNGLPEREGMNATVFEAYTLYKNNWTEEAAELLADNLSAIVEGILGEDLGDLINNLLADGVYSDSIINSLIELVVNLLGDFKDFLGALGIVGAEGIADWFNYCEQVDETTYVEATEEQLADATVVKYSKVTTDGEDTYTVDANGTYVAETEKVWVCTHEWGIDEIEDATEKRDAFVDAMAQVLEPANRILAWLLIGEDFTFFVESENSGTEDEPKYEPLLTLAGGQGYAHAIAPLFELLGCVREDKNGDLCTTLPDSTNIDSMIRAILDGVVDILEDICEDPVGAVLELLPNLIYFLNSGAVETVVNNLLVPVDSLLVALKGFGVDVDIKALLADIGLDGLTTKALLDMLSTELGITFPAVLAEFFATFYIGEAVEYTSVDGQTGVRLAYNDEEDAGDMLTILLSLVLDLAAYEQNEAVLVDLLGQDIYDAIMAVFEIEADDAADRYKDYEWYSTNAGEVLSPIESSGTSFEAEAAYNEIWTPEMAKFITDNLVDFATDILCLLGIKIGDMRICSLDDLVNGLLGGMLYTQDMADTILNALKDLVSAITDLEFGEPLLGIIRSALGVDLGAWNTMTVTVVDGDRDSFITGLKKILAPIVPLLDVLLCGESLTLFYSYADLLTDEQEAAMSEEELEFYYANQGVITIPGSEGYALAIAPIFEALGCIDETTNISTLMSPEDFKSLSDEDKMGHIIDVLLTRVDKILEDPVNNLFTLLPGLIFFVNSNGLDTAVTNLAAGVDTVLAALTPILGEDTDGDGVKEEVSLMSLLGVELAEYNFEYLMNLLMDLLNEYITDNQLQTYLIDFVAELTTGEVVAYQTANGDTYYTARYASEQQLADMITIILRLVVKWVATGNNGAALIELLGVFSEDEEAAKSSAAFINFILAALDLEYPASSMMAAVYWIFYALYTVADPAHDGYHDLNSTWSAVYSFLDAEAGPTTKNLIDVIKKFFSVDLDLDGVIDQDGIASDGALTFFEKIAAFFQKIIDFFKSLFGG